MSYKNPPIVTPPSPSGLDLVIETIRANLAQLTWLEKSFGRAWEFKEKKTDGQIVKIAKVFIGQTDVKDGEYVPVPHNDYFKAQSFIKVSGPEEWDQFNRFEGSMKSRKLSIIFWVNLKDIDVSKNYIFIDELKGQVEQILQRLPCTKSMDAYYDERVEDVFDGYSIEDVETQYLMYPYSGMRFDITAIYPEVCSGNDPSVVLIPLQTPYKKYVALLNQHTTGAPVATIIENTLSGVPVWTRVAAGEYVATLNGAFISNKTVIFISPGVSGAVLYANSGNENEVSVNSVGGDSVMKSASFEIRVYS